MVAYLKTVWVAVTCLFLVLSSVYGRLPLVQSMDSKRFFSKFREYAPSGGISLKDYDDFVHDGPLDNQANDIAYPFPSNRNVARTAKLHHRSHKMSTPCLPRPKRRGAFLDAFHIGDISFPITTRKEYGNWNRSVHAECTFLVGLSDFKQTSLDRPQEHVLSWNKLKTSCRVSSSINGMRDGKGEAEVYVGPLRMLVRVPKSEELSSPEMQMSQARDARVTIRDLGGFPNDFLKEISAEIEKNILCIVNSDVRDVLMDSMKCLRTGTTSSCKLPDGY